MLKISEQESVTLFYMGRSPLGFLLYPVYAFLVGDTLIDTGTNRADKEFLAALKGRKINRKLSIPIITKTTSATMRMFRNCSGYRYMLIHSRCPIWKIRA